MKNIYDLIIIGSGVSGMAAAIYAGRFEMKTLVIGELPGGTITKTHMVENYPGYKRLSGYELAGHLQEHVADIGVEIKQGKIEKISRKDEKSFFTLTTSSGENYQTKTVLLATGTEHRELNVPGEKEFKNHGVSYCATCDGPFFRNKVVAIAGGSDSAVKESLLLAKYAKQVYIVYRGEEVRAEPINKKRMAEATNIEVINNTNIIEILGEQTVNKIKFDTGKELECHGVFIEIGRTARTELAAQINVNLNQKGEVIINKASKTNIAGFYAAGDCTNTDWKQAIIGVAEGCMAAYSAYQYVAAN